MRISDWSSDVCSSDLTSTAAPVSRPDLSRSSAIFASSSANVSVTVRMGACSATSKKDRPSSRVRLATETIWRSPHRSEEHTSELQSLMRISYAVFCLKKKKINRSYTTTDTTK